jgi:hypothetical protein
MGYYANPVVLPANTLLKILLVFWWYFITFVTVLDRLAQDVTPMYKEE